VRIRDDDMGDEFALNLTSMTDIVFLMLIFFMLATTMEKPEGSLGIELPSASSSDEAPPREIVIHVLEDGGIVLDGTLLDGEALRARLAEMGRTAPATPVTIRGHKLARHQAIVSVMDACGAAGLHNLAVGTTREERG
jgi:biopolymer transport protein ExbD